MPAIQPARLRQQAAMLADHFEDPPAFVRSLHHLLDFYAERARRPGQSGQPAPLVLAYKVRPPVLRLLLREIIPLAMENPEKGLALCDALWQEPYLEFRTLACMLLGQVPASPPSPIVKRVLVWITPELENHLIDSLLTHGLARLRQQEQGAIIRLIEDWLNSEGIFERQLGLRALLPVIEDPNFENLPVFFRMIQPLTRSAPPALRSDLLDVLAALARRSPKETAYFLRQSLPLPSATDTPWLIRQSLNAFPPDTQESLRAALRGLGGQTAK